MAMNDDSMIKIMETLGLDYGPAERSTKAFEGRIASLNKQLFEMKANAIKGAGDINRAFSSQLGGMGGSKVILDQYGQPLKVLNDNMASSFVKSTAAAKQHGQAVQDVTKKYNILGNEFQRRTSWFLTGTLFYGTIRAALETVQAISQVERGVTEIARVMEDSSFVFKDYRNELLQLGVDYGQTFDTVQDIALRWAQAGYNVTDSLENTKTSLLALNTAELNATNATESMIGIMAQWKLTSKDLPLVLDEINKTADDFTVTSQDLVDGLLRSSGAARIMGLSIEQTISLLTVMREASGRTGREVGNALNSILSYIQRPKAINVFEALGIKMFIDDARTQFRPAMEIFTELSKRWGSSSKEIKDGFVEAAQEAGLFSEELSIALGTEEEYITMTEKAAEAQKEFTDIEKRDAAQASAGIYRRNYLIGLLERFSKTQEVLNGMTDAAGYSQSENARTMGTLEKKYTSLKTAAQELAVALGDAGLLDVLKDITEGAKNATDGFADLDEGAKALVLTALELLAAVAALKGVMGLFTTKGILDVVAMAGPWGLLAAAIAATTGAVALYAYNSSKATAQSIDDSLKSVDAKKNEADEVDKLIQKYQDLEGQAVQNNEVKAEMLDIQRQLASIYPGYVDGLDKEGNKLITNIPLLREINALKAQELEIERQRILMDARTRIPQLEAEQKRLQENVDRNKARLASGDTTKTLRKGADIAAIDMAGQIRKEIIENLEALAASQFEQEMINSIIKGATGSYYDYMEDTLSGKDLRRKLAVGGTGGIVGDTETETVQTGGGTYTNKPLQEALRLLQHKKHMNQIGLEDEIAYLKNVEALHVKTGEERMDITERIYNAENALRDKMLQDSVNWINEKRNLGELSAEQEIAAWNRVLTNQKNNIKAVKEATVNLYKLQKDLREDEVKEHKDSLKDLQDSIKDLYDERIDFIEKESDAKVKAIEEELKLLDREDSGYDYDTKMADLEEQLAYWSVRTGENARQQLADVRKKIAEAEHDREVELKKQGLEDEKEAVEDAADEEKEKWEAAYKDMEKAFSDHNLDIIAQAATYSKEAYKQWYDNYIVPMQEALKNGDAEGYEESVGKVGGSIGGLASHDYGMTDSDYRQFIANGKLWYSASASEQASLQTQNDALRDKYDIPAGEYPAFHSGGQSLTSGLARIIPGEIFFPPSFSTDLKTLIAVSSGITGKVANGDTYNSTDKSVINNFNAPLFNSEKTVFEDDTDETSFARELNRAILSIP